MFCKYILLLEKPLWKKTKVMTRFGLLTDWLKGKSDYVICGRISRRSNVIEKQGRFVMTV